MKTIFIHIILFPARFISIFKQNRSTSIFWPIESVLSILLITLLIAGCSSSRYHAYFTNPPDINYPEYNEKMPPKIILQDAHHVALGITASTSVEPTLIEEQTTFFGPDINEKNLDRIILRRTEKQKTLMASREIIKGKKTFEIEDNKDKARKGWYLALSIILFILGIVFAIGGAWSVLLIVFSVLAFVGSVIYFIRWLRNTNLEKKDGKTSIGKILLILAGVALLLGLTFILFDF